MTTYLTVGDYLVQRSVTLPPPFDPECEWQPDLTAVWAALAAPAAQVGTTALHNGLLEKAAVQTELLVTRHDVDPSEDPIALCLVQTFLVINEVAWEHSFGESDEFCLLAAEVRARRRGRPDLTRWIAGHVVVDGRRWLSSPEE